MSDTTATLILAAVLGCLLLVLAAIRVVRTWWRLRAPRLVTCPETEGARRSHHRRDGIAPHQPVRRSVLVAGRLFMLALAPLLRSGMPAPNQRRPGRLPCRHHRPAVVRE